MALLTPEEQFDALKTKIKETIRGYFPIEGQNVEIVLNSVDIEDRTDSEDLRSQMKALKTGSTWAVPVYANLSLKRNDKEIDRRRILLMHLPKTTQRFGYIVNGTEYQTLNQFRLKPGVYHTLARNGVLRSEFNLGNPEQLVNGRDFKINFTPSEGVFYLSHKTSEIPLYHLLRGAGVDDQTLEKAWGREILKKNQERTSAKDVYSRFYRAVHGTKPTNPDEHAALFSTLLKHTKLLPETTWQTLDKEYKAVEPDTLVRSTKKLLDISRGDEEVDDKTSLGFQTIHSFEDLLDGQLKRAASKVKRRLVQKLRRKRNLKNVINADDFDRVIRGFFGTSLVDTPEQVNPLEMLAGRMKTTIMGEQGGIKSPFQVSEEAKLINPSHLGFLDPIHTPEGDKTGISLVLALGTKKEGNQLRSLVVNAKTNRAERIDPGKAVKSVVAFPDQYERKHGKLVPRGDLVKATHEGEIVHVQPSKVDYIIPSPRSVFGVASNLIPFLQNNQGNRTMVAARQQEQAVPLKEREAPLVQVQTDRDQSFEELLGTYASRRSPVNGVVDQVKSDAVVIRSGSKKYEVQFYKDFPLKGHSLYDSEVLVKEGDKVKKGQLLVDSTFTRDGKLALGTNLRVGYLPFHGYNFEDGIVISEKAAKKLTSLHMYNKSLTRDPDTKVGRSKFLAQHPHAYIRQQLEKIGPDGIIQVGATVEEGDPLILAVRKPKDSIYRKQIRKFRRGRPLKMRDASLTWDLPYKGAVTDISRSGKDLVVNIKTEEPAQVGDKIVGRHGNKGVITRIIPNAQMPYTEDEQGEKEHLDVALNPLGVPGRINLGQILETVAGKIAEERGKPYLVRNFVPGKDYLESLKKEMKEQGIEDKVELVNPDTGKPFDQKGLVGNQYILKLKHQVGKKLSARSGTGGPGAHYDINHAPSGGAPHGGQTLGELGMYAMLAHGARENLHEMFAYKSNKNEELWDAIREGTPIPTPKVPFAYDKFLKYLNALRVNVKKEGNNLVLVPFTEEQVRSLSSGELKEPGLIYRGKDKIPEKGGLFDPTITGGKEGMRWAHFTLSEPMPNPLFESAIKKLLGITQREYDAYIRGDKKVNGKAGGAALQELLKQVDVKKQRAALEEKIKRVGKSTRAKLHAQLRILRALDDQGLSPTVYMMKSVPVIPPVFRPVVVRDDGRLSTDDLNGLYKEIAATNEALGANKHIGMPDEQLRELREELYDGLKAFTGTGGSLTREWRGVLDLISGKIRKPTGGDSGSAKTGYFQKRLLKRRQDFSGRSIITPEPRMGLDELGLPEDIAWEMYRPFIERELVRQGYKTMDASDAVTSRTPAAEKALERAMESRPVFLKRDPALHKFNVLAFKPRLIGGKAIEIHPLVTSGYNADFDGDAMSVYLPIREASVKEANNLFPSNNLFSSTTGAVMYTPGHEALLGLYLLSQPGKKTDKKYRHVADAISAERRGDIKATDIITVGGHETTLGRLRIEAALPEKLREIGKKPLSQMRVFDKGMTKKVLTHVAKHYENRYGEVANALLNLGNEYSTSVGFSIGLDDFSVVGKKNRDLLIHGAERKAAKIRQSSLGRKAQDKKIVEIYQVINEELDRINAMSFDRAPTNISMMVDSGSRGSREQLKQIVSTPALVMDAKSRVVPYLIPKSYSEGMDLASYWTTLHGARKGTLQKVQGVRDPGYMSKQVINSTMNLLVTEKDCGTNQGIWLDLDDPDILDRYTAGSASVLVTPVLVAAARKMNKKALYVRSPMRCEAKHGVCQKCMGLAAGSKSYDVGDNVGVMAGQAIGEPATQLSLRVFHTGGLARGKGAESKDMFVRLQHVLRMPKNLPGAAPLAKTTGRVTKVVKAPQGGELVYIGSKEHYIPEDQTRTVKLRGIVQKGEALSDGSVDPRELLHLRGIQAVQDYIASELQRVLMTAVPVRRRNAEVLSKALTNVTRVDDPGEHPDWLPGDLRPTSVVRAWNKKAKKPVLHTPILKGVDILPLEMQEDWMARLNFQKLNKTLTQAAREGWATNIHGFHPIPAAAQATEFGKGRKVLGDEWKGQY